MAIPLRPGAYLPGLPSPTPVVPAVPAVPAVPGVVPAAGVGRRRSLLEVLNSLLGSGRNTPGGVAAPWRAQAQQAVTQWAASPRPTGTMPAAADSFPLLQQLIAGRQPGMGSVAPPARPTGGLANYLTGLGR